MWSVGCGVQGVGSGYLLDISHNHAEGEEQLRVVVVLGSVESVDDLAVGVQPQLVEDHLLEPVMAAARTCWIRIFLNFYSGLF